jgi:ADP-ribosylglycohydrolase
MSVLTIHQTISFSGVHSQSLYRSQFVFLINSLNPLIIADHNRNLNRVFNLVEIQAMQLPDDYEERVYAGVLGKVIGVYLGRPFEGWSHEHIMANLGEINYYVHDKLGVPLIVSDDDITGTFTFIRALADHNNSADITAAQIGHSWLNYIIRDKSILWWGGMGNSTEHTAFIRLEDGMEAPMSGSMEINGKVVSEQIGAQIFIDSWAMVAPGDPEMAAELARKAASVSHDGEAIYGAQVIAAMEAAAFYEADLNKLIDLGISFIPADSVIYRLIQDIREWHAVESDWKKTRQQIEDRYGYHIYGGNCHMVPNHGLIIHSLLHGEDDFSQTLKIVNTCGWDTDCNSGNVGCLMGIKNGLAGIDAGQDKGVDWRGPVADKLYMPTADGGRVISDCVTEAYEIVNTGRTLRGQVPSVPKSGAKFHFEMPGSVQGFTIDDDPLLDAGAAIHNVEGHSLHGKRSLQISFSAGSCRVTSPTFVTSKATAKYFETAGYAIMASPRLHSGQKVSLGFSAQCETGVVRLAYKVYVENDEVETRYGPQQSISDNADYHLEFTIPDTQLRPISEIGIEVQSDTGGAIFLDYLTWEGVPETDFSRPSGKGTMWRRAWVQGTDGFNIFAPEPFRVVQNRGTGLLMQGTRDWIDYRVVADVTPHLAKSAGIAARVQGMRRYYAMVVTQEKQLQIIKTLHSTTVLAAMDFDWQFGDTLPMALEVKGANLRGFINDNLVLEAEDPQHSFQAGGIALLCQEGRTATHRVKIGAL